MGKGIFALPFAYPLCIRITLVCTFSQKIPITSLLLQIYAISAFCIFLKGNVEVMRATNKSLFWMDTTSFTAIWWLTRKMVWCSLRASTYKRYLWKDRPSFLVIYGLSAEHRFGFRCVTMAQVFAKVITWDCEWRWDNKVRAGTCRFYWYLTGAALTLMLLVANFANTKSCKKNPEKSLKPWQMGTHLRVLREGYPMNTNKSGFQWFSKIFAFFCCGGGSSLSIKWG